MIDKPPLMKTLLRLEEVAMFGFSLYLFSLTGYAWWWYPGLLFVPDIGMLGYLINPKFGAATYNLLHHKGLAILLVFTGWYFSFSILALSGIIIFGHASLDRIMGYGLKYRDSFKFTHLDTLK